MKRALLFFTGFSKQIGGSEYLAFLLIKELQKSCEVTVALQHAGADPLAVAEIYGIHLSRENLKLIVLEPKSRFLGKLDRVFDSLWRRRLRRIGPRYDICISCANVVDFGRPGFHFIFMLALDNSFRNYFWGGKPSSVVSIIKEICRNSIERLSMVVAGCRKVAKIVADEKETIIPNSEFVRKTLEAHYHCKIGPVFYPPTTYEFANIHRNKNLDVLSIGRIAPEKRVADMIEIVRIARNKSGLPFRIRLAGLCSNPVVAKQIDELSKLYDWVVLEGVVVGEKKSKLFGECSFALHACKIEAFGISVAEYLKAGVVPIVPVEGGPAEIVDYAPLLYGTLDEAADILIRLSTDERFYNECAGHCAQRSKFFSAATYFKRQSELIGKITGE